MIKQLLAVASLMVVSTSLAMPAGSRVTLPSGKKVFVSGMNLAWINYANDVGNTPLTSNTLAQMGDAMKAVRDSGGNTMRIWLSTDGTKDPIYTNGLVSKPGTSTIANIQKMLQLAKTNNILLMPVLLTHNWVNKDINGTILANNKTMLTTDAGLQAYIDNYLTPVVTAIGNDPNLLCWEVFNEPEGMVQGWSSPANTITKLQVQKAVNRIAGAIHRAVPGVLVSNGAASTASVTWYTDANLKAAGADADGTVDFYMAHYYGWNGASTSPFTKSYAAWGFDKPLVIGEYASSDWSNSTPSSSAMQDAGGKVDTLMAYLNTAGYAGGLGWQYQPDAGDPWMKGFATFGHSLRVAYRADSNSIKLDGTSNGTFSVSVGAGLGGSVTSTPSGRIDSGASVTLKAVPQSGYTFTGWSGDTTATDSVLVIAKVVKDWMLQANFKPDAGTNLIKDGDFTASTAWGFYAAKNNTATATYTSGAAVVVVSAQDDTIYHVQLSQSGIPLDSGVTYILSFDATSTVARTMEFGFSGGAPDWMWLGGSSAELPAAKKSFQFPIVALGTSAAAILQFNLGAALGTVTLDNVSLVRQGTSSVQGRTVRDAALSLRAVAGGYAWTRSSALSAPATVRLIDGNGRELQRSQVASGVASGFVPSTGTGIRFVVLESAQGREILPVVGTR